jgi:hypothetical protein
MIRRRLERVEERLAGIAPPDRCGRCGGPRGVPGGILIVDEGGRPLAPNCPVCGLVVDERGRARLESPRCARPGWKRVVIHLDRASARTCSAGIATAPEAGSLA